MEELFFSRKKWKIYYRTVISSTYCPANISNHFSPTRISSSLGRLVVLLAFPSLNNMLIFICILYFKNSNYTNTNWICLYSEPITQIVIFEIDKFIFYLTSWKDALLKRTNLRNFKLRNEHSFIDTTQKHFIFVISFPSGPYLIFKKAILWFICCILNEPRFSTDKKPRNKFNPKVPQLQHLL